MSTTSTVPDLQHRCATRETLETPFYHICNTVPQHVGLKLLRATPPCDYWQTLLIGALRLARSAVEVNVPAIYIHR
jgi:hypothetical protein